MDGHLENDAISTIQCWSQCGEIRHSELTLAKSALGSVSPCFLNLSTTSNLATMVTLFMSPLADDRAAWQKRLGGIPRTHHLTDWIIKILLSRGCLLVDIHLGQNISMILLSYRDPCIYLFSKLSVTKFPILFHPDSWPSSQNTSYMNWYIITHLAISPSTQNKQPDALLDVLPIRRICLHHCPSGTSQKGEAVL